MNVHDEMASVNPGKNGIAYKWIALSNVFIATLMAFINTNIILISLPAIFNGIHINPLTSFQYLLWMMMGYGVVMATLLLTFGRLSDMFGRVRIFKLGFLVFTVGSVLLFLTPGTGDEGALELIFFRLLQGVGAAMIVSNSSAILTDAFPPDERGKALGLNMVAVLAGQVIGLVLGGILSIYDWRLVFLVSIPFAALGTIWSYLQLKEPTFKPRAGKIDLWGNLTFVAGLTILLIGMTYGLMPYGDNTMGWGSPWVIAALTIGVLLLVAFIVIESRVKSPMFRLELFSIRAFSLGNFAGFFSSAAMMGTMIVLILLLQGIWLPLHGYRYDETPLWAGIYMMPMMLGIILMGPISGILSDRHGPRWIATGGMLLVVVSLLLMAWLPSDFAYLELAIALFLMGLGFGMFMSPNSSSIMNSVPPEDRGVASGMMATMRNTANTLGLVVFFTIVLIGINSSFPDAVTSSLSDIGASSLAPLVKNIPPSGALFAAFLGYNPVTAMMANIPSNVQGMISPQTLETLKSSTWFPSMLSRAFMPSLRTSFLIGALLCIIAGVLSALRGKRYVHEIHADRLTTLMADGGSEADETIK
ncbi:MAG TPA: MFS transporter [Methanocella sp.]|nr:MFS transporter [Methanocella sp.]